MALQMPKWPKHRLAGRDEIKAKDGSRESLIQLGTKFLVYIKDEPLHEMHQIQPKDFTGLVAHCVVDFMPCKNLYVCLQGPQGLTTAILTSDQIRKSQREQTEMQKKGYEVKDLPRAVLKLDFCGIPAEKWPQWPDAVVRRYGTKNYLLPLGLRFFKYQKEFPIVESDGRERNVDGLVAFAICGYDHQNERFHCAVAPCCLSPVLVFTKLEILKELHENGQPDRGQGVFFQDGQPDFDKIDVKQGTGKVVFDERNSMLPGFANPAAGNGTIGASSSGQAPGTPGGKLNNSNSENSVNKNSFINARTAMTFSGKKRKEAAEELSFIFARGTGYSGSPSGKVASSPDIVDDDHLRRENKLLEDRIGKLQMEGGASELQAELSEILEKQRALQTELSRTKADNFILEDEIADLKNRLGEDSPSSRPANAIPVNLDNEAIQLAEDRLFLMAALGGFHGPQKFVPNRHAVPDLNAKTKGAAEVWWKHFDTRKTNYLTKSEAYWALVTTYGLDRRPHHPDKVRVIRQTLEAMWPDWDPNRTGKLTKAMFLKPVDGVAAILTSNMPPPAPFRPQAQKSWFG